MSARRPLIALFGLLGLAGCGGPADDAPPSGPRVSPSTTPLQAATAPKSAGRPVGDRLSGSVYQPVNPTIPQEPSRFRFTEITGESGVDFVHHSGMTPEKHFPTANGSGLAILDFDNDGRMDLYFASFQYLDPEASRKGSNRLYRNLGDGRFEDATERAGVGFVGACHGVLAADLDNDGDQDLVLCNYGANVLYRNDNGSFVDVSASAGIDRPAWSSSAATLDYDGDGDLDLYISTYGSWDFARDAGKFCGDTATGVRLYCSPREVPTVQHLFYRNEGQLTFTDVTEEVGLGRDPADRGHGFGIVAADLNQDGRTDLYVANDMNPNFLFLNRGDGTFEDATEESGAAYDDKGNAQSGMGVDAEDVDDDGLPELFVTNFANEYNTLYQNLGKGRFFDQTPPFGLAADSMPWVGWGCGLVDLDNDGWPDLFVANGHVDDNREGTDYAEPPLLHRNTPLGSSPSASRRFKLSTRDAGPYFAAKHVGRGVAFGDLDNDGDLDIVVSHKDGPPAILRNDTPNAGRWIRLALTGQRSNRDGVGARVEIVVGERTIHRQRKSGGSMMSSHDPRLIVGLGEAAEAPRVTVRWPSGAQSVLEHVAAGTTQEIVEPAEADVATR